VCLSTANSINETSQAATQKRKKKDGTLHLTMNLMVENKTKTCQKTHDNSANKSLRDDEGNARQLPMHLTLSGKT
jgi:hypothetical protein